MGLGVCTLAAQHIKVEIIVERLSRKAQMFFDIINYLIVIFVSLIIGWQSIMQGLLVKGRGASGYITHIPFYPFYFMVAFSFFLMLLSGVVLLLETLQGKEARS
jgi:TRAP-type C4-dicarboxylate transport system permease small subunit